MCVFVDKSLSDLTCVLICGLNIFQAIGFGGGNLV